MLLELAKHHHPWPHSGPYSLKGGRPGSTRSDSEVINTEIALAPALTSSVLLGYPRSCATRRIGTNNRLGWACRVPKP